MRSLSLSLASQFDFIGVRLQCYTILSFTLWHLTIGEDDAFVRLYSRELMNQFAQSYCLHTLLLKFIELNLLHSSE